MKLYKKICSLFSKNSREKNWAQVSHPFDTIVKIDGVEVSVGKYTYGVGNIQLAYHRN